jgi:glycosyl transferase family 25
MINIKSFVINLERRIDKLLKFKQSCPIENITIVKAFDKLNIKTNNILSYTYNEKQYDINISEKFNLLSDGAIGCFISHVNIWKHIIDNNLEYALIMEDDTIFCNDFLNKLNNVIKDFKEIIPNYKIIYIGGRFTPNFIMNANNYIKISDTCVKHNINRININQQWNYDRQQFDRTTQCYIITRNIAEIFFGLFTNTKIYRAVDAWMLDILHILHIDIYDSIPLLCYSPLNVDSDIVH